MQVLFIPFFLFSAFSPLTCAEVYFSFSDVSARPFPIISKIIFGELWYLETAFVCKAIANNTAALQLAFGELAAGRPLHGLYLIRTIMTLIFATHPATPQSY